MRPNSVLHSIATGKSLTSQLSTKGITSVRETREQLPSRMGPNSIMYILNVFNWFRLAAKSTSVGLWFALNL